MQKILERKLYRTVATRPTAYNLNVAALEFNGSERIAPLLFK